MYIYVANVSEQCICRVYVTACNAHMHSHTNSATNHIKGTKELALECAVLMFRKIISFCMQLQYCYTVHAKCFLWNIHD